MFIYLCIYSGILLDDNTTNETNNQNHFNMTQQQENDLGLAWMPNEWEGGIKSGTNAGEHATSAAQSFLHPNLMFNSNQSSLHPIVNFDSNFGGIEQMMEFNTEANPETPNYFK